METYTRAEAIEKVKLTKIPVGDSEKNIIAQNILVNAMGYGWQVGGFIAKQNEDSSTLNLIAMRRRDS